MPHDTPNPPRGLRRLSDKKRVTMAHFI